MNEADSPSAAALVRQFLGSLMLAALISDDVEGQRHRDAAREARASILERRDELDVLKLDGLWWLAVGDAEKPELRGREDHIEYGQPKICPFTIPEIVAPGFDVDRAVQHLRESAATG